MPDPTAALHGVAKFASASTASAANTLVSDSASRVATEWLMVLIGGFFGDGGTGATEYTIAQSAGTATVGTPVTPTSPGSTVANTQGNDGGTASFRCKAIYLPVLTPGTLTVTVTRTAGTITFSWYAVFVAVTNPGSIGAVGAAQDNVSATTFTVTADAVPAPTSLGLMAVFNNEGAGATAAVQPTGTTELSDQVDAANGSAFETAKKEGTIGSPPNQANQFTGLTTIGAFGRGAIFVEIDGLPTNGVQSRDRDRRAVREMAGGRGRLATRDRGRQQRSQFDLYHAASVGVVSADGTASAVSAAVTASASNPVASTLVQANAVAASVTVTANNPAASGTATASAVSATVTASASNPLASSMTVANPLAASVTVTATNPVASGGAKASAVAATVTASATNPVATPYFLYDDFSGSSIDSTIWTVYNRLGDQANSEVDAVIPANVRVSSGTLKIDSKFEDVVAGDTTTGPPNPRTVHYTSGQIAQTRPAFLYGTVEVRAKICGGTGTWPCIWMLGTNWQASQPFTADDPAGQVGWPTGGWWEVDIAEFINGHRTLQNCALHFVTANRGASGEKTIPFDATTRFMVYRLEWTATSMKWKIDAEDGNGFVTLLSMTGVPGTDIPNTAAFLIIHTAIGGFGGTPDSATFPVSTEVDWARITLDPQTGYPPGAVVTATASNPAVSGNGTASAVAATVTVTATDPVASGTATASAVAAPVTVTASNPVVHGNATASAVSALVTVTANNPAASGTAQASAVAATVTTTATNPAGSGTALASPVAALVAVTAADPTVTGTATASAVNALVAVTATNPVGQTAGDAVAHPVAASVTVTATDPAFTTSSTASAVMALVTVTATDPVVSGTGTASAVFALVAVTASNPVSHGTATASVVAALVTVTATDPGFSGAGTATPAFAAITAGATNPTLRLTATVTVIAALVVITASNPTVTAAGPVVVRPIMRLSSRTAMMTSATHRVSPSRAQTSDYTAGG